MNETKEQVLVHFSETLKRIGIEESAAARIVNGEDIESDFLTSKYLERLHALNVRSMLTCVLGAGRVLGHMCREAPGRLPERVTVAFRIIALASAALESEQPDNNISLILELFEYLKTISPKGLL